MESLIDAGVAPASTPTVLPGRSEHFRRVDSRLIAARSADVAVLDADRSVWRDARIHSVFEHVINIDLGNARLLTIAHRDSDDAPDTVVADVNDWSGRRLRVGHAVHFMGEKIFLGEGHCLTLEDAQPWSCRLPTYARDDANFAANLRANLRVAQDCLARNGQGLGAQDRPADGIDRELSERFRAGRDGLCAAIDGNDERAALRHVDQLVGLGPGLTPAGDDYLVGLLAVLNLPKSPCGAWRRIGGQVVAAAVRRTNSISLAALRHAASGQVREKLVRFCRAMIDKDAAATLGALEPVLAIGASSGTDIALGVLAGFELHARHA